MPFLKKFIKLMKSELIPKHDKKRRNQWVIDESKYLHEEEIKKLKKEANKCRKYGLGHRKFTAIRNWFMVELGLNTGLRVEEMTSLQGDSLLIDKDRSSIVVIGKGNKKRVVWISQDFKKTCCVYLEYKKRFGYGTGSEDYLLNNLKGGRISKRALQKFFKIVIKRANLSNRYHIHNLRHTYTTFLLIASGRDYDFVSKQLGHTSIRTTQTYAGVVERIARKAIEKMYK